MRYRKWTLWMGLLLAGSNLFGQVFTGTNAPGTAQNFSVSVGAGATNLAVTLGGSSSGYSHVFVRRTVAPTQTVYDFSSQDNAVTNGVYLELPELQAGTYYVRVYTPPGSPTHPFSLVVQTNSSGLRTAARPVSKVFGSEATGKAALNVWEYFRVEIRSNVFWKVTVDSASIAPGIFAQYGQLPTRTSVKRCLETSNNIVAFTASETQVGQYCVGVLKTTGTGTTPYTLKLDRFEPQTLVWDPGTSHRGTEVVTNSTGTPGDYYFRIVTANPSLGAWRTALRLQNTNEANLYLGRGVLPGPNPDATMYASERPGSDGMVLALSSQFLPNEEWFLLVRAKTGAQWTLVSGTPFVQQLGTVAEDASSGSGEVEIGPEGMRYFRTTTPAGISAWALYLNGKANSIYVKSNSLPVTIASPKAGYPELSQVGQMLVVTPYLNAAQQYYIGIPGEPHSTVNLDSRVHGIQELAFGGTATLNTTGFPYKTYRVAVPSDTVAWRLYLTSTNNNQNLAVRRNYVPNEQYNDAFSELFGSTADQVTLVPPALSDGAFYITVYGTNGPATNVFSFNLQNGPPEVTEIPYACVITNDQPDRVGWRFFRVSSQPPTALGWDVQLTNTVPGTRIALRRGNVPSSWVNRPPGNGEVNNYFDLPSPGEFSKPRTFLQLPDQQAGIWYIGIYHPSNALGAFTLITKALEATPLAENSPVVRTNMAPGKWDFFSFTVTTQDLQGPGAALGWDLRLSEVWTGTPQLVIRRDGLPTNSTVSTVSKSGTNWLTGQQWAADKDWTLRTYSPDGATNQDRRILALAAGKPLVPGTYYIGVLNTAATNEGAYTLLSRWIGGNRTIPVEDLADWSSSKATNTVNPREACYYRVVVPAGVPSWRVKLTALSGEAMLSIRTNWIPSVDSEKKMQKGANEHYLRLPDSGTTLLPGTNYLAVIGEGVGPVDDNRIGMGPTSFMLEMLGALPVQKLGTIGQEDIVVTGSVEGGSTAAYRFEAPAGLMGFWVMLEDKVGNPVLVYRGGTELSDPGLQGDPYGNEDGETDGLASGYLVIVNLGSGTASSTHNVVVKARASGGEYPDASYTLRIRPIIPEDLPFDGMVKVTTPENGLEKYFRVIVPSDALGWDLRLTDIISGYPVTRIGRDYLPIGKTPPFNPNQYNASEWPSGAVWGTDYDWTRRSESPDGQSELGRIAAMGMGRPLEPGIYYVRVDGFGGMDCSLTSRGIGEGYSIGVTNLAFAGGEVTVQDLPPREAAYFRVEIPEAVTNWKVRLTGHNGGECLLIAAKDFIPNVGALQEGNSRSTAGRKMQKLGQEEFVLLPQPGEDSLPAGVYYLAVVSEGNGIADPLQVGSDPVSFTLTSFGQQLPVPLGTVSSADLVITNTLFGGETRFYQFQVPTNTETVVLTLEQRGGNPVMTVIPGAALPNPGAQGPQVQTDTYGSEGGAVPIGVNASLITLANPTNPVYTIAVKARAATATWNANQMIADAAYILRVSANSTIPLNFDGGLAMIEKQPARQWRWFKVIVPPEAEGWDIRLLSVSNGSPRLVVRRESLPDGVFTTSGWQPVSATTWPTNNHWAADKDWTKRSLSPSGTNEDYRVLAMGMNRPLQPGLYIVGVSNASTTVATSYSLLSRGIGSGFTIPIIELPFGEGTATNFGLAAREAAYYRVVVPSNAPSWKLKVSGLTDVGGEFMLAGLRGALPNVLNVAGSSLTTGRAMQQPGNEHFALLPATGFSTVTAGTNYLAVVSEGLNPVGLPGAQGRVGLGASAFVITSIGTLDPVDLGFLYGQSVLEYPDTLECGEVKTYRFTILPGTSAVKVTLGSRSGNPVMVALAGDRFPNPGAAVPGQTADSYGYEGGYTSSEGGATIFTIPEPKPGVYSLSVKARPVAVSGGNNYPDAGFTLRVQPIEIPDLNFASEQNTNGYSHQFTGNLEDNERNFFRVVVPPSNPDGSSVIGWQLTLRKSNQAAQAWLRARPGRLPGDANSAAQTPFSENQLLVVPPFLTNGIWYVEVKGSNSTSFTLESSPLRLQRSPWSMPARNETLSAPGLAYPLLGDSGVSEDGVPLPDQEIELEQGYTHLYAVEVPPNNPGILRTLLLHSSGSPNLYIRPAAPPTVSHSLSGGSGSVFERSMLAVAGTSHDFGHWVPLDGKAETELSPGTWYLAVRAGGTSNARYRLQLFAAEFQDLALNGPGVRDVVLEHAGDWFYCRVRVPSALPVQLSVTLERTLGDLVMHLRDSLPPGNGSDNLQAQVRDWTTDKKNNATYGSFADPGTYTFKTGTLRPGQDLYLGFRARKRSQFSVRVDDTSTNVQEPTVVPFYGGETVAMVDGNSAVQFRVDVPLDARRWKHFSVHPTNLVVWLDQGALPTSTANIWKSSGANSSNNKPLTVWNNTEKLFEPAAWPWVPGQSYFFVVTNVTAVAQEFTLRMDGRNDSNDDNDGNRLLDAWELFYFGKTGQNPAADPDGDGLTNEEESLAGTNPFSGASTSVRLWTFASNGSVEVNPAGTLFEMGSTVRLTAVATPGYTFSSWGGDLAGTVNPTNIVMSAERTVLAIMKRVGDDFEQAIPLSGSVLTAYATNLACTKQTGEPNHAGNAGGKSIWWSWVAPLSGKISLGTGGSTFRTLLAVYTGSALGSLEPVVSALDASVSRSGCEVIFEANLGTRYYFAVDGKDGAEGRATLTLSTSESSLRPRVSHFQMLADGSVELGIVAEANRDCAVEFSDDLKVWEELLSVPTSGGTIFINDRSASDSVVRFYRVNLR